MSKGVHCRSIAARNRQGNNAAIGVAGDVLFNRPAFKHNGLPDTTKEPNMPADWPRFKTYFCHCPSISLTLDISRMSFDEAFLAKMLPEMNKAFAAMDALEGGS